MSIPSNAPVLVVGAGIMGAGIAQVSAQAGHPVFLYDVRDGAAAEAKRKLAAALEGLAAKGKLAPDAVAAALQRIVPLASLQEGAGARLVVEAIVEQLDAKRSLFRQLEDVVAPEAVLATNTSSISVTAIANGLKHPGRLVGMHFFNPVPLMKLVEVVSGLHTDPAVAQAIFDLARTWGKVPVHAKSTPGFIVNRIARPFYAETLALLLEQAAAPNVIDACIKAVGFRMGPCELMDLIGHDTNFAVTQSVYEANFGDKRYAPSLVQREMVDGGLLGRKSGRGFYHYGQPGQTQATPPAAVPGAPAALPPADRVVLHGRGAVIERWIAALSPAGRPYERQEASAWCGLEADGAQLRVTDGRAAGLVAATEGVDDIALFDLPLFAPPGAALAWCAGAGASPGWKERAAQWLAAAGYVPCAVADVPGLVVARTLAMLVNEAADAVQQGVCTPDAADAAMKLGVNYPAGPFEWLAAWSAREIAGLLDHLDAHYRGERYRVSLHLRQRAWAPKVDGRRA